MKVSIRSQGEYVYVVQSPDGVVCGFYGSAFSELVKLPPIQTKLLQTLSYMGIERCNGFVSKHLPLQKIQCRSVTGVIFGSALIWKPHPQILIGRLKRWWKNV